MSLFLSLSIYSLFKVRAVDVVAHGPAFFMHNGEKVFVKMWREEKNDPATDFPHAL